MFVLWRFGPVRLYRGKREPAGALRRWSPRNVIFTATETLFSRTQPGTDGSNPSLSSGESGANLTFCGCEVGAGLVGDQFQAQMPSGDLVISRRTEVIMMHEDLDEPKRGV